ncbi:MAG: alanine racemase [Clostridia bacterium]|nr:alanine racemase [Clostridia bacterium]
MSDKNKSRAWLEVDLGALMANYREAHSLLKPGVEMICVLKADAYGYGAKRVGQALYEGGVRFFAVATVPEALELIDALPKDIRVLCMGEPAPEEFETCIRAGIRVTVGRAEILPALSRAVQLMNRPAIVHIKLDTGLHRLGFTDVADLLPAMKQEGIIYEGVYSHLALRSREQSCVQHDLFAEMVKTLEAAGWRFPMVHLLDSIGLVRYPDWQYDAVRVGAFLYGNVPPAYEHFERRQAVGRFCARVKRVVTVPAGEGIGYDETPLTRETRVATLSVGYVDGYARSLSGAGEVEIHGCRAKVLGLICMDQMMVDVTDIPDVRAGDTAVLLGGGITLNELAEWGHLNRNGVTACIGPRVPRVYKS